MCRWLAYTGSPLLLEGALYAPVHSLIDQSLHSELRAETTNGDGFGVGWCLVQCPGAISFAEACARRRSVRQPFVGTIAIR